jgi:hypothetical protein
MWWTHQVQNCVTSWRPLRTWGTGIPEIQNKCEPFRPNFEGILSVQIHAAPIDGSCKKRVVLMHRMMAVMADMDVEAGSHGRHLPKWRQ